MRIPCGSRPGAPQLAGALALCAALSAIACGKEGPPLPPLRLVPAPATEIVARRFQLQVELRFVLPSRNQNGPGRVDLDHIEVFAMTLAPGAQPPPNRDLLSKRFLVGTIPVQPAPEEGEPVKTDSGEKRPAPGERAVFLEELTAEKLTPAPVVTTGDAAGSGPAQPAGPVPPGAQTPAGAQPPAGAQSQPVKPGEIPATTPGAASPSASTYPVRVYALRGVSRSGRAGPPAPRVTVPLVDPAPNPGTIEVDFTERAYQIRWIPPVGEPGDPPVAFNVYAAGATDAPLNPKPIAATELEHAPVRFGEQQCFIVRSVKTVQGVTIESASNQPVCTVAHDKFPPATPTGLTVISTAEGISLSWNANREEDLAGYFVLRGEEPGETLQALTPDPIRDTNYRDTAVKPGVTYVYAVVSTDKATPPNVSVRSAPERATAR